MNEETAKLIAISALRTYVVDFIDLIIQLAEQENLPPELKMISINMHKKRIDTYLEAINVLEKETMTEIV